MKKTLATALSTLFLAPAAFAQSFTDEARVLEARPIHERIPIQREECWNEQVRGYENRTVTRSDTGAPIGPGTVLGAIIGGVAGHQVGSGRGNTAATIAGTIAGGAIGNQIDRSNQPGAATELERVPTTRNVERCRMIEEVREVTSAWDVRYSYRGREFAARMPFNPGKTLRVAVNVTPVERRDDDRRGQGPGPRPVPPRY